MAVPSQVTEPSADLATTEHRLAATLLLLLGALLISRFLVPMAIRFAGRVVEQRFVRGRLKRLSEQVGSSVPWRVLGWVLIRSGQLAMGFLAILSLLVIWDRWAWIDIIVAATVTAAPYVWNVILTVLLLAGAYVGIDSLRSYISDLVSRTNRLTQHQEEIAFRVTELVVLTSVGLVVLTIWGVNLGGLLVGAGFLGIVVGLAARQTIGSLIAGFVLMFARPFEIGDWVVIGDEEGRVTDITIVNTRLENMDGEFVSIPNDRVANNVITNRSRKGRLRIRLEVGIDYGADPERAKEVALAALEEMDQVMRVPQPQAVANRLADSSIVIELRFWIDNPSPRRKAYATDEAIARVKGAFESEGIKIPFPQRELSSRETNGEVRIAKGAESVVEDDRPPQG